jgi:Arc-like DNA binding domain
MARKPTDTVQLKLRFPEALRRQLERAAKANDRSLNSEIVGRLEGSFSSDPAVDLIALAMWMESVDGKNWKDARLSADTVRIAVDRIIAGLAGLPLEHPTLAKISELPVVASRADSLARAILRKSGSKYPKGSYPPESSR